MKTLFIQVVVVCLTIAIYVLPVLACEGGGP